MLFEFVPILGEITQKPSSKLIIFLFYIRQSLYPKGTAASNIQNKFDNNYPVSLNCSAILL
jgi:hypothetical protein